MLEEIATTVDTDMVQVTIRRNQKGWIIFLYDPHFQNGNGRTFQDHGQAAEDVWASVKAQWDNRDA